MVADRNSVGLAALLATLVVTGCVNQPLSSRTVVVEERLRDRDFGEPAHEHQPMLAIGRTAREVIVAPEILPITDLQTALFEDGLIEADIDVAAVSEDSVIGLEVIALGVPVLLGTEAANAIAAGGRFIRLDRGWTIEPLGAGRLRLQVDAEAVADAVPDEQETLQLLFKLVASDPVPSRLRSRSFVLPSAASLELPWGLLASRPGERAEPIELRGILDCGGEADELLAETITAGVDAEGWRVPQIDVSGKEGLCQLELIQLGSNGRASPLIVWGAPQILISEDEESLRIVLISLDTLRADHMSGYGYARSTTPVMDRELLARGVRFTDAMTTIASTGTAHLSLFTGEFPRAQLPNGRIGRNTATPTLAELLQKGSYATAAFTEDGLISGPFGFWYGFDLFREYHVLSEGRGAGVFADGIDYIRENRDRRFFLFLHTYRVHDPWDPTPASSGLFRDSADWSQGKLDSRIPKRQRAVVDDYDRTIVDADQMVAGFLDELERLGLSENTLVVLVSDHGEAFGEHGILGHGLAAHQEQLQIPLVFRGPGIAEGVVREDPVGITDVASTILELAGLPFEGVGSSRSLAGLLRVETDKRESPPILPESPLFFTRLLGESPKNSFDGVRMGDQKLMREGNRCSLFSMSADPQENQPTTVACSESRLAAEIDRYRTRSQAERLDKQAAANEQPAISRDTAESLRVLGYVE
ncbi:MAG: sulfatase [Candidatus Binatia bacterium]|nr:sulfatase [Candidatus Binatia bacterium]